MRRRLYHRTFDLLTVAAVRKLESLKEPIETQMLGPWSFPAAESRQRSDSDYVAVKAAPFPKLLDSVYFTAILI
jgi:hypothetical protein